MNYEYIKQQDHEVYAALRGETERQKTGLELIPSENYVSRAVLEASGSIFTNKYSEGYPGKRYYGGQTYTDAVERLAQERICKLMKAQYANVQPLSGAVANLAVYTALLEPGDTVMGMDLSHGGHLTHGHPLTHPAKIFNFVTYKMSDPETGAIDYEDMREVALREKPKLIIAGFSAYSRNLDYQKFVAIAREVGAVAMADMAHIAGPIAAGVLENPLETGFDVMTFTTHKSLRGPRGGVVVVREDETLAKKINRSVFPGIQGGPLMQQIAAKAVAFGEALDPSFREYQTLVLANAKAMAEVFTNAGVRLLGGGTDNHLVLADVTDMGITGQEAEDVLDKVGITLNKNSIADDPRGPMDPSGIRFGTPAITSRGMGVDECTQIAKWMVEVLENPTDEEVHSRVRQNILEICEKFPVPDKFV